jgi:uncharacterized membrane protein YdjX (TVP38/TMEM64 family)
MKRNQYKGIIGILAIVVLFIAATILVQNNLEYLRNLIGVGLGSVLIYILIIILEVVVAPISALPLIPVAVGLWGWFNAGVIVIIGWTIGSVIAFLLARKFGMPIVEMFVSMKKVESFEKYIPKKHVFWGIVFLRMAIPADILSYVIGLVSKIKLKDYTLATFIGLTPIAFTLAYLGSLSLYFQLIALFIALLIIFVGLMIAWGVKKKRKIKR